MAKRISVYIDGANFYYGLKTINKRDRDEQEYYIIKGDDIHLSLDMLRDACKDIRNWFI